jgi:hypothetical protein
MTGVQQSEVREKLSGTSEDTAPTPTPFRALRAVRMRYSAPTELQRTSAPTLDPSRTYVRP